MQQVEIDTLATQSLQTALTGRLNAIPTGVVRIHLADQKHLVPAPGDSLAHHQFRTTLAVHLGGIDQTQAQIQPLTQRRNLTRALAIIFPHAPGSLSYHRYLHAGQFNSAHRFLPCGW